MIDITNIHSGWLTLHIGNKSFGVSYLTDVVSELTDFVIYHLVEQKYFYLMEKEKNYILLQEKSTRM
jgi:hypothetical protein